jgi:uncharacterized membrane protein YhhN
VNSSAWLLLVLFFAVAAVDWAAAHLGSKRVEYVAKPGCMVLLIAAALALDPVDGAARVLLVLALLASTAGDVFLMLPGREPGTEGPNLFVAGLASFFAAHLFYVLGFVLEGVSLGGLVLGAIPVALLVLLVGQRVLTGVQGSDEPELVEPVTAYIGVISAMLLFAFGTQDLRAEAGALLFAGSDSLIAWERFIKERPWGPMVIIVAYHLAQALLVVSFT